MNETLVFVKPPASNSKEFQKFVKEFLQANQILVTKELEITNGEPEKLINLHYSQISKESLGGDPLNYELSDEVKEEIKKAIGIEWSDAIIAKRVINLQELKAKRPDWTDQYITTLWRKYPSIKLSPGIYVGRVPGEVSSDIHDPNTDLLVINGFYGGMVEDYKGTTPLVKAFVCEFETTKQFSWSDFRLKVLGATEPSKADPNSIRGQLFARHEEFGLHFEPRNPRNGCHGSASALEATRELGIWANIALEDTLLFRNVRATCKAPDRIKKVILRLLANEICSIPSLEKGMSPAFDLFEGVDIQQTVQILDNDLLQFLIEPRTKSLSVFGRKSISSPDKKVTDDLRKSMKRVSKEMDSPTKIESKMSKVEDNPLADVPTGAVPFSPDFRKSSKGSSSNNNNNNKVSTSLVVDIKSELPSSPSSTKATGPKQAQGCCILM